MANEELRKKVNYRPPDVRCGTCKHLLPVEQGGKDMYFQCSSLNSETKDGFWVQENSVCDLYEKAEREDYLARQKAYLKMYGMDEPE